MEEADVSLVTVSDAGAVDYKYINVKVCVVASTNIIVTFNVKCAI